MKNIRSEIQKRIYKIESEVGSQCVMFEMENVGRMHCFLLVRWEIDKALIGWTA